MMSTLETTQINDDFIVRVKAQVMVRDDSKGGWLPIPNAMSVIGILKRRLVANDDLRHEYRIFGNRLSDHSEVINCKLKRDTEYTNNTTFVHWKTDETKFGLTFLSYSDAKAFDKSVKRAMQDMMGKTNSEEAIFMPVQLPMGHRDSSTSTLSTLAGSPTHSSPGHSVKVTTQPAQDSATDLHYTEHPHLQKVVYVSRKPKPETKSQAGSDKSGNPQNIWARQHDRPLTDPASDGKRQLPKEYYVHFSKTKSSSHEYQYPNLSPKTAKKDEIVKVKGHQASGNIPPPLPKKKRKNSKEPRRDYLLSGQRLKCKYCSQWYSTDDNQKGSCSEAPDKTQEAIEKVTCMKLGEGLIYHCASDSEGNYTHPCVCDGNRKMNCRKMTVMAVLAVFCPCVLCYMPLTTCHRGCLAGGCSGGRHKPSS